jgi:4-amino-4-deoxy-L-arabinose transferase-like glycosyltransferase
MPIALTQNHQSSQIIWWQRPLLHRILICLVFAVGLSPAIGWIEFSGGMENFNVATALESQRDNHWLMPYLGMEPRLAKPPLLHWITAVGIELVPNSLPWGARGSSILASCAMLLAVYELGRTLDDSLLGLTAAFVCGTTILFLKFAWQASYDLHLALWVTIANWQLAQATFKERRWSGCLWAGVALGLGTMAKGPMILLQTVAPLAAFFAWRRWRWKSPPLYSAAAWTAPAIAGLGLMLAVALPWTLYAMWINRHMLGLVYNELSLGTEAAYETRIRWHGYIVFFPLMLPWLIWFLTGLVEVFRAGRSAARLWLAIFWLFLPIAVMTFFPERRDRYLLPMVGPAALLAAYGVLRHVPRWRQWTPFQLTLVLLHAAVLIVIAIALPIWGSYKILNVEGHPWYTRGLATAVVAAALAILLAAVLVYRRSRIGFVAGTVGLTLLANLVFLYGYKDSSSGRSQGKLLAMQILNAYPNADVYNAAPQRRKFLPLELLIYLNRDVRPLPDPAALAPSDRPQILIYPPDQAQPDWAFVVPPGFHEIAQRMINTGVYHAFVRERG